ncbi:hypothetical protein J6590_050386 [Homalodisca vitripennis]|nr:hypothetical protein J6590_050386 [Homalodisca vitripennis]
MQDLEENRPCLPMQDDTGYEDKYSIFIPELWRIHHCPEMLDMGTLKVKRLKVNIS